MTCHPATLSSSVCGKLVRFLVADGDHIEQEMPYAELEIMKIYLTLHAPESGRISLAMPAGCSIDVDDVVATSDFNDPTKVRPSENYPANFRKFVRHRQLAQKPIIGLTSLSRMLSFLYAIMTLIERR